MRPRGALCGCCENALLWDVETVLLYGRWRVGRSRLSSYFEGMSSGVVWWNQFNSKSEVNGFVRKQ